MNVINDAISYSMNFRELLRNEYKIFEEQRKNQKETDMCDYTDLEQELQRKFSELFGDDDE